MQRSNGEPAHFECFVEHRFSPESLSEQHREALERALWTALRRLKERAVLHKELVERKRRNEGGNELMRRLEELIVTTESDLKFLRQILERISFFLLSAIAEEQSRHLPRICSFAGDASAAAGHRIFRTRTRAFRSDALSHRGTVTDHCGHSFFDYVPLNLPEPQR
jgi:hypothetical protein